MAHYLPVGTVGVWVLLLFVELRRARPPANAAAALPPILLPPSAPAAVLSYALLADLAVNFLRSLVSKSWQESGGWAGSAAAAALAERAAEGVAALARLHDSYLLCRDPVVTLKVAAGLWALSILGAYMRCVVGVRQPVGGWVVGMLAGGVRWSLSRWPQGLWALPILGVYMRCAGGWVVC